MKKLFFILIMLFAFTVNAQTWQDNLPKNKNVDDFTFYDYQEAFNTYWGSSDVKNGYYIDTKGEKQKASGWNQFKRWEYYWESRVHAITGAFPKKVAIDIYKDWKKDKSTTSLISLTGNWQSLGPFASTVGSTGIGRTNVIAFHSTDENTYWVGTPAGGLWQTNDDGLTWSTSTDTNDVLGVSEIAISSNFDVDNTMYIGTGDRDGGSLSTLSGGQYNDNNSIGVLKSTDGGNTWDTTGLSFSASQGILLNCMLIDPIDNNTLYVATSIGLFKTNDAGIEWTQLTATSYKDIKFNPENSAIIYASTKYGDIDRSTDSGVSFTNVLSTSEARVEMAVTQDNPAVVYAVIDGYYSNAKIFKSIDSGASFTEAYTGSLNIIGRYCDGSSYDFDDQGWYNLCIAVDPTNANTLFVGGINTWKSTDGGENWLYTSGGCDGVSQHVHVDKHYLAFQNGTSTLFECNDGGINKTMDLGNYWIDKSDGIVNSQMYRIGVSKTEVNAVITGLQDNGTKLRGADTNWKKINGADGMECIIDYSDYNIQYAINQFGSIVKTTNGWGSKINITKSGDWINGISSSESNAWVTPYIIDKNNPSTLYLGLKDLWKTTNRGNSWIKITTINTSQKIRSIAISESDSEYIYIADLDQLWVTSDGGESWIDRTAGLPITINKITYIAVKNDDPNTLWVTFGGYDGDRVYQSVDGGVSWINISTGLPNLPIMSIVHNRQNTEEIELYVGTDVGVFIKIGSDNWQQYRTGLPNVIVSELEIYYDQDILENSRLLAGTYGRGLWKTHLYTEPAGPMVYSSSITTQKNTTYLIEGSIDEEIIGIKVNTTGNESTINLTSFSFTTTGSTNPTTEISNAKVYYTSDSNSFDTTNLFGTIVENPNGSFTIDGTQVLISGTNYFWLAYDIAATAIGNNVVDATCSSITVNGTNEIPIITNPEGNRKILSVTDHFVTIWKTDNEGFSNDTTIEIPTYLGEIYNYDIDWDGDGVFDEFGITSNATHDYGEIGTYTVRIRGAFPRIYFYENPWGDWVSDAPKILSIEQWGTQAWTSMASAFKGCINLNGVMSDIPNLSKVTDMSYMFNFAKTFNQPIGSWNVSNVTNMQSLFKEADHFNQDIGSWNVSNVTGMRSMFLKSFAFNQDIGSWNVGNVLNMKYMFYQATDFNQDIGSWNVENVTEMTNMFKYITLSTTNYDNLLIGWDAQNLHQNIDFHGGNAQYCLGKDARDNMVKLIEDGGDNWTITDAGMEIDCLAEINPNNFVTTWSTSQVGFTASTTITIPTHPAETYNYDVDWDNDGVFDEFEITGSITHDYGVEGVYTIRIQGNFPYIYFNNCGNRQKIIRVDQWGTQIWSSMENSFYGCCYLNGTTNDIPDLSNVTNMSSMFRGATLFNQDIGSWDVSNVVYMSQMFQSANSFNQDIGNWDVGNVVDMSHMFRSAHSFNQDIGSWDVGNVVDMSHMFFVAYSFNQDIGSWNVNSIVDMSSLFLGITLSTNNYDSLLLGWDAQDLQPNVNFHGGYSQYCEGTEARANMMNNIASGGDNWSISDGGRQTGCTVDTNDVEYSEILIFPNPTKGEFTIISKTQAVMDIVVYDSLGKKILKTKNQSVDTFYSLDLSKYVSGIYYISLKTDKEQTVKKIVLLK